MNDKKESEVDKIVDLEKKDGLDVFTNYEPIKSDLDDTDPPTEDSDSE